jgi:hypothetical protein
MVATSRPSRTCASITLPPIRCLSWAGVPAATARPWSRSRSDWRDGRPHRGTAWSAARRSRVRPARRRQHAPTERERPERGGEPGHRELARTSFDSHADSGPNRAGTRRGHRRNCHPERRGGTAGHARGDSARRGNLPIPPRRRSISQAVRPEQQGSAVGSNQSLQVGAEALTGVIGGLLAALATLLPLDTKALLAVAAAALLSRHPAGTT